MFSLIEWPLNFSKSSFYFQVFWDYLYICMDQDTGVSIDTLIQKSFFKTTVWPSSRLNEPYLQNNNGSLEFKLVRIQPRIYLYFSECICVLHKLHDTRLVPSRYTATTIIIVLIILILILLIIITTTAVNYLFNHTLVQ